MRRLLLFLLMLCTNLAFADDQSVQALAADAVQVQAAQAFPAKAGASTKVIMRFVNNSEQGHIVIAAYSPIAKQVQLQTVVMVGKRKYTVQVHSFALGLSSTTWLGRSQKHIALMGLNQTLVHGQKIPLIVIYRDGSYSQLTVPVVSAS